MDNTETRRSGFTMIELLTVLVIMVIILSMSVAVVGGLQTRKGPEGGQRVILRMIELTRQAAIQQNKPVALLFARKDDQSDFTDTAMQKRLGGLPSNASGVYLRPCLINRQNQFVSYFADTQWELLPERGVFAIDDPSDWEEVDFPSGDGEVIGSSKKLYALVFKPNGSLRGTKNPKLGVYPIDGKHFVSGSQLNFYYEIEVNWLTGKATVTRKKE